MTTLTIKINERTKVGKTFISLIELLSKEKRGIEIIEELKKDKELENSPIILQGKLKQHVLKTFEETDQKNGLSEKQTAENFLKEIETW